MHGLVWLVCILAQVVWSGLYIRNNPFFMVCMHSGSIYFTDWTMTYGLDKYFTDVTDERSADETIFYRPVVDRLEMYLIFVVDRMIFSDLLHGLDNCSYVKLLYRRPDCIMYILRIKFCGRDSDILNLSRCSYTAKNEVRNLYQIRYNSATTLGIPKSGMWFIPIF